MASGPHHYWMAEVLLARAEEAWANVDISQDWSVEQVRHYRESAMVHAQLALAGAVGEAPNGSKYAEQWIEVLDQ